MVGPLRMRNSSVNFDLRYLIGFGNVTLHMRYDGLEVRRADTFDTRPVYTVGGGLLLPENALSCLGCVSGRRVDHFFD